MHSDDPSDRLWNQDKIVPDITTSEGDRWGAGEEGRKDCGVLPVLFLSDERNSRHRHNRSCDLRTRCHGCNLRKRFAFEAESA